MSAVELDLDAVEVPDEPSVVFRLDGREWLCKHREAIPALIVDALLVGVPLNLERFFRGVLADGQGDDFAVLLARPDSPLTLSRVQRLSEVLAEAVLNRPTLRSAPSGRGPQSTEVTSKAGSSSPDSRRKRRAG